MGSAPKVEAAKTGPGLALGPVPQRAEGGPARHSGNAPNGWTRRREERPGAMNCVSIWTRRSRRSRTSRRSCASLSSVRPTTWRAAR